MRNKWQLSYDSNLAWRTFLKQVKRRKSQQARIAGEHRHAVTMKRHAEKHGKLFHSSRKSTFRPNRPPFPENIKFLAGVSNLFSNRSYSRSDDGIFLIPKCFSLLDNYQESFEFLKRLFVVLYKWKTKKIILDYKNCDRIDVDASICMDVILAEFINYRNHCIRKGCYPIMPETITPVNIEKDSVQKVLFSIGAYKTLRGFSIKFDDVEPLPVLINRLNRPEVWAKNEIDLTKIVEYIKDCLKRMNKFLTVDAESEFYKVIGEVLSNADEHATVPLRYAIGFFQETHSESDHFGVFNFSIFNFGDSIYQTFKSPNCRSPRAVAEMEGLSSDYTQKGWFNKAEFEEETLWTLYSLQEGVTSKEKKRGNGSIGYIENFFKLRGPEVDEISKMVVISGNTRVLFDGTYSIVSKAIPGRVKSFKMITFNTTGKIEDKPDKKFVTFAPHYFPGALISARILIKHNNTNTDINE